MRLLDLYLANNFEKYDDYLSFLFDNCPESLQEYKKWKNSRKISSHSTEHYDLREHSKSEYSLPEFKSFLKFDHSQIKKKTLPLTKWLPILNKTQQSYFSSIKIKHLNMEQMKISTTLKGNFSIYFEKLLSLQTSIDKKGFFIEKIPFGDDKTAFFCYSKELVINVPNEKRLVKNHIKLINKEEYLPNPEEISLKMNIVFLMKKLIRKKKQLRNLEKDEELTKFKLILNELDPDTKELFKNELNGSETNMLEFFFELKEKLTINL